MGLSTFNSSLNFNKLFNKRFSSSRLEASSASQLNEAGNGGGGGLLISGLQKIKSIDSTVRYRCKDRER